MQTTNHRPRISTLAGTSGKRTLTGLTLEQDKHRRAQLAETDKAAYLAAGGHQPARPAASPTEELSEEIRTLFLANDWASFSSR